MAHCGGFWATLELLTSDSTPQAFAEDIEDWLNDVSNKVKFDLKNVPTKKSSKETDQENEFKDYRTLIEFK